MMKWIGSLVLSAGLALTGSSSAAEGQDAACRQALETLVSAWAATAAAQPDATGAAPSSPARTQLRQAREECAAGRVEAAVTRIAAASGVLAWLDLDESRVVATRHAAGLAGAAK